MNITIFKKPNGHGTDIQNELHTFAIITGKQLGLQSLPKSFGEYNALFLNVLKSKIQSYIKGVELDKKPQTQKVLAQENQKAKDGTIRLLRSDLMDEETKKNMLEGQVEDMPFTKWGLLKHFCIKLVVLLLSFAESFMVYSAFRSSGIPTLGAAIASFAIGLGLYVITDYIAYWLLASKKMLIAWVRGIFISLIMFLFFYGISLIRVSGMSSEAEINKRFSDTPIVTQQIPAYTLALISTGMFMIGVLITMWHGLTKDEKELLKQYFKKWWQLRKVKRKINKIEGAIAETEKKAFEVSKQAITTYEEAYTSQSLLNHYGDEAVALFIATNMKHRTDGYCPPFFTNPNEFNKSNFSQKQNNNKL